MTNTSQKTTALFASIVSIAISGFGCSDSGTDGNGSGGAPGSGGAASTSGGATASGGQSNGSGGLVGSGGAQSGGATGSGGASASGGSASGGTSAGGSSAGGAASGGNGSGKGGAGTAGSGNGGSSNGGSGTAGSGSGGAAAGGAASGGKTGSGGATSSGPCTASKSTGRNVTGTGPHKVVVETNSDNGIKCGTIYRPADLGGTEKYPIFVWGEGACSQDGYSNAAAMGEIASWGYFVVADGTPNASGACAGGQDGKSLISYVTWAIEENGKSCSAYKDSLDTTKVAADGFSCGGLMAENASSDPRFTAVGITSSGLMGNGKSVWDKMHAPFKIMNGGSSDVAYQNGLNDYDGIAQRGIPVLYFSKTSAGHGGDLGQGRGSFNLVNLAWLNWQLKGDEGATGKGYLMGSSCKICSDSGWVTKSANFK